jgi:uncharacterized lipoprotein YddW (UPF0748 family)
MRKIHLLFLVAILVLSQSALGDTPESRAVWAHPGDFGKTEIEVVKFFETLKQAHIQVVVPLVKDTAGHIFWHSRRFPAAVHPDYKNFDLLRAITAVAPRYKIKVHAWLCDFPEGKDSPAFKLHPEWAMLNPQGGLTSEEKITPEQTYDPVWMCPNQRPGYTDQWLLPMIEEIVRDYPVDGIQHDYVRYPGDVAPDSYCFCDYCLERYMTDNLFYYPSRPDVQIPLKDVRLRSESNWDLDFTVKPADWARLTREEKAKFILDGKSINRPDLDYFFYEMRCAAINRFVREAWEKATAIRPGIEMSAAVFINPAMSGRFIGQNWTDFAPWVDVMMTMTYRSHFQGGFEDYQVYLGDVVRAQNRWVAGPESLAVGLDAYYIFKEEREPWEKALGQLKTSLTADGKEEFADLMKANISYLGRFSASQAKELSAAVDAFVQGKTTAAAMSEAVGRVLADPPPGFFPEAKLLQTIETVRKAGGLGIIIFAASHLTRNKLWGALEKAFSNPATPAYQSRPDLNRLSIRAWRALRENP